MLNAAAAATVREPSDQFGNRHISLATVISIRQPIYQFGNRHISSAINSCTEVHRVYLDGAQTDQLWVVTNPSHPLEDAMYTVGGGQMTCC